MTNGAAVLKVVVAAAKALCVNLKNVVVAGEVIIWLVPVRKTSPLLAVKVPCWRKSPVIDNWSGAMNVVAGTIHRAVVDAELLSVKSAFVVMTRSPLVPTATNKPLP